MGGAYAQDSQGWKRAWGLWGLGSRNRGAQACPHPCLRGQGISPGSPAGFLGSSGKGKHPPLLSCSCSLGGALRPASPNLPGFSPMPPGPMWLGGEWSCRAGHRPGSSAGFLGLSGWGNRPPLLPEGPSHLPLLFSPQPPSYCPQGPMRPRGGFGGQGTGLGAQQASWARVGGAIALCSSPTPPGSPYCFNSTFISNCYCFFLYITIFGGYTGVSLKAIQCLTVLFVIA